MERMRNTKNTGGFYNLRLVMIPHALPPKCSHPSGCHLVNHLVSLTAI